MNTTWEDTAYPYDRVRVRHLLDRMEMLIAEARMRGESPVRFVLSRDVGDQHVHDASAEMPMLIWGVPCETRDELPPNGIILETDAAGRVPA